MEVVRVAPPSCLGVSGCMLSQIASRIRIAEGARTSPVVKPMLRCEPAAACCLVEDVSSWGISSPD